jgi:hypothetical protein
MTRDEFLNNNRPIWSELEESLKRTRRYRANKMSPTQLDRLGYLYRRVTSGLAVARRDFPDDHCVPYLNALAARAHAGIYQSAPLKRNTIRHFFLAGFPALFRSNCRFVAAAFLMFVVGFIAAYWIALENHGLAEKLAPQHIVETIRDKEMWTDVPALHRNLFASFVMTNNIRVAFSAFALGITFMIGTMYILAFNGVLIGTVAGLCHVHGLALPLWSFVSPHVHDWHNVYFGFQRCTHWHSRRTMPRSWACSSTMVLCFTTRLYRIDNHFYRGRRRVKNGLRSDRAGFADAKTGVD